MSNEKEFLGTGKILVPRNVLDGFISNPTRYDKIEREDVQNAGVTFTKEVANGTFNGHRFANTWVKIIPEWDFSRNVYACGKYNDPANHKELQELIIECSLIKDDHLITTGNFKNRRDSFFTHDFLHVNAEEGYYMFKKGNPIDKIMIECLRDNNKVFFSDDITGGSQDVKFYVVDIDYKMKAQIKKSQQKQDILRRYMALTPADKRRMAYIMGEDIEQSSTDEYVNSMLFHMIDNPTKIVGHYSTSSRISDLISMSDEVLDKKMIVAKCIKYSLYDKRNGIFYYNGVPMGKSTDEIEGFLMDNDNSDVYYIMKDAVTARESEGKNPQNYEPRFQNKEEFKGKRKKVVDIDKLPDNTGEEE